MFEIRINGYAFNYDQLRDALDHDAAEFCIDIGINARTYREMLHECRLRGYTIN